MSPRRNRPRRNGAHRNPAVGRAAGRDTGAGLDSDRVRRGVMAVQAFGDGEWTMRLIPGGAASKAYRCPGCDQEIRPGVAHVVAWPAGGLGDQSDRRHWHTGCWRARDRRAPDVQRSRSAPRYG